MSGRLRSGGPEVLGTMVFIVFHSRAENSVIVVSLQNSSEQNNGRAIASKHGFCLLLRTQHPHHDAVFLGG